MLPRALAYIVLIQQFDSLLAVRDEAGGTAASNEPYILANADLKKCYNGVWEKYHDFGYHGGDESVALANMQQYFNELEADVHKKSAFDGCWNCLQSLKNTWHPAYKQQGLATSSFAVFMQDTVCADASLEHDSYYTTVAWKELCGEDAFSRSGMKKLCCLQQWRTHGCKNLGD